MQNELGKGAFQELDQVKAVQQFCKYAGQASSAKDIVPTVTAAVKVCAIPLSCMASHAPTPIPPPPKLSALLGLNAWCDARPDFLKPSVCWSNSWMVQCSGILLTAQKVVDVFFVMPCKHQAAIGGRHALFSPQRQEHVEHSCHKRHLVLYLHTLAFGCLGVAC